MQRYFTEKCKGNYLVLDDSDVHHIKNVMRMNDGDFIEVVYNLEVYKCEIENIADSKFKILEKLEFKLDKKPFITLIIPLLKEQKLDYILQKSTELGVDEIIFTNFSRSIIKLDDKKLENKMSRWSKICKEASEQSKRNNIPNLLFIKDFKDLKDLDGINFICSTEEKLKTIKNALKKVNVYDRINIVIGPEGGISPLEEEYLYNNGYIRTTLGNRIMRVETVPLYLLSIINYEFME